MWAYHCHAAESWEAQFRTNYVIGFGESALAETAGRGEFLSHGSTIIELSQLRRGGFLGGDAVRALQFPARDGGVPLVLWDDLSRREVLFALRCAGGSF